MVTAELALAIPSLVVVLVLAVSSAAVAVDQVRCTDAARVGARLLVRGEEPASVLAEVRSAAPPQAAVHMSREGSRVGVRVVAAAPAALRWMGAAARPSAAVSGISETAAHDDAP